MPVQRWENEKAPLLCKRSVCSRDGKRTGNLYDCVVLIFAADSLQVLPTVVIVFESIVKTFVFNASVVCSVSWKHVVDRLSPVMTRAFLIVHLAVVLEWFFLSRFYSCLDLQCYSDTLFV